MAEGSQEKKNIHPERENRKMGLVIAEIRGQPQESEDIYIPSYCDTSATDFLSVKNSGWFNED